MGAVVLALMTPRSGSAQSGNPLECFSPVDQLVGNTVTMSCFAYYEQTSPTRLVMEGGILRPSLYANIRSTASLAVSAATLNIPSKPPRDAEFRKSFGFSYSGAYDTREALEIAAPAAGDYRLSVKTAKGSGAAVLRFPSQGWPAVPRFSNYDALQNADAAGDVVVSWDVPPGANEADTYVSLTLYAGSNGFTASSTCSNRGTGFGDVFRQIPVSATSVVIPKGFLRPDSLYELKLKVQRYLITASDLVGIGTQATQLSIETRTTLKTRGINPILPAKIVNLEFGDGGLSIRFSGVAGRVFVIESADDVRGPWAEVYRTTTGEPDVEVSFPADRFGEQEFFRVITL